MVLLLSPARPRVAPQAEQEGGLVSSLGLTKVQTWHGQPPTGGGETGAGFLRLGTISVIVEEGEGFSPPALDAGPFRFFLRLSLEDLALVVVIEDNEERRSIAARPAAVPGGRLEDEEEDDGEDGIVSAPLAVIFGNDVDVVDLDCDDGSAPAVRNCSAQPAPSAVLVKEWCMWAYGVDLKLVRI